jgi:hypothetical protein
LRPLVLPLHPYACSAMMEVGGTTSRAIADDGVVGSGDDNSELTA